ncbi:MAG: hypothetical protein H0X51_01945 [Parachlamydiaceae bacterium]|nr:hypothetical protein [Parachlamydiaceae bacterium]
MKKAICKILGALLVSYTSLHAEVDIDTDDFGAENIHPFSNSDEQRPFSVNITGDAVGKADFKKWYLDDQHLEYRDIEIEGSAVFYYDPSCEEALAISVGYEYTRLAWSQNPFFNETKFHTVDVSLGLFTHRAQNWFWRAQLSLNLDPDHLNFNEYTSYDGVLWGRYDYCSNIGIHTGLIFQTGMKIDRVYPIIGFDWQITDSWKLNVVYPVNMSLVYQWNRCWSLAVAARALDHRQRVSQTEPLSKGLWAYRSKGVEGAVNYDYNSWLHANLHAGYTLGTKLTISDRHNRHKRHFKLDSAGYFGGEVQASF